MKKLVPFLGLLIVFAWGFGKSEKKEETEKASTTVKEVTKSNKKIVARVNGRPVYEEDLMGRPLKGIIDIEILYQVGLKQGIDKKYEENVETYKKGLIIDAVTSEVVNNLPNEVSNKDIEDYYNENEIKYTNFHLKKIIAKDKQTAEEIQKRAKSGEDIDEIASDYSLKVANVNLRGLPFVNKYNLLFTENKVGSVSNIDETKNGFEILIIVEKNEVPLHKVNRGIRYTLLAKRREAAIQEFADKIKEENKINGDTEEILYQEGIKRGLDKKVQDRAEEYKKILILNEVNREIVKTLDREITDKEIEDLYNENEDRYTYFHVKRITTTDRGIADAIHKRASDGEDLEKIASDHSLKVANVSIRDLGFENKYKNLFKGKDVGSVIDIIETDKGFEILKIVDKTKVPVPQSKPLLKFNLLRNRRSNAIDNLRDKNQIIVEIVENKEGS